MKLHVHLSNTPSVYYDNIGVTYLCTKLVYHSKIKHVSTDYHFVHDMVSTDQLRVAHVSSKDQLVDTQTKPLSRQQL